MIGRYKTWVFDCDGVLLDSNQVKTHAMFEVAKPYGDEAAKTLVEYNKANGGISRFEKFHYFFDSILKRENFNADLDQALGRFAELSREGLLKAPEATGLRNLLKRIAQESSQAFVVSGGMQQEVRDVFEARGLTPFFTGIFGSPDTKDEILHREFDGKGSMEWPAVYIGDSQYDYEAASRSKLDFVFVSGWTEFSDWQSYFKDNKVLIVKDLTYFLSTLN
jgi:phosphoglycolate phosphatase-like HAD superfamily hydrolase